MHPTKTSLWYVAAASRGLMLLCLICSLMPLPSLAGNDYRIGVYYFPGWRDMALHAPSPRPWEAIKLYPERKPLLGWYLEGEQAVADTQLAWMKSYGIDYVIYDWYFADQQIYLEHALKAYLNSPNRKGVNFSIMLANNESKIRGKADWRKIVTYWVENYFSRPEYLRIDNKPVVFIADAGTFSQQAAKVKVPVTELFRIARILAKRAGFKGVHFVGGTGAYEPMISTQAKNEGYAALSAYNYHAGPEAAENSRNYVELQAGYQEHWQRFNKKSSLPYIVPMSAGWDKRPWGGSLDPLHDNSHSNSGSFKQHLLSARAFMDSAPGLTKRMGVICCWNEYGEGSYIEPTEAHQFDYLQEVLSVFGPNR